MGSVYPLGVQTRCRHELTGIIRDGSRDKTRFTSLWVALVSENEWIWSSFSQFGPSLASFICRFIFSPTATPRGIGTKMLSQILQGLLLTQIGSLERPLAHWCIHEVHLLLPKIGRLKIRLCPVLGWQFLSHISALRNREVQLLPQSVFTSSPQCLGMGVRSFIRHDMKPPKPFLTARCNGFELSLIGVDKVQTSDPPLFVTLF